MKQSGILQKLLILFSLIVMPVIIFGILVQWKTSQTMKNNILTSAKARLEDSVMRMDDKFSETNDLAGSLLSKGRVKRIANPNDPMNPYERSVNVNFIRDTMTSIKLRNPAVNNIRLYLPFMEIYYNSDNVYDYRQKRFLGSQKAMDSLLYEELLSFREVSSRPHIHDGNMVFLQYSPGKRPDAIVETIYTASELTPYFEESLLYEDSLFFFDVTQYPYTLTNCTDDSLQQAVLQSASADIFSVRHNGVRYYAFPFYLQEAGARYFQVIPADLLMMNLTVSAQYTIIFTAAILLCATLFVFGAFRIIKRPVSELSQAFLEIENRRFDTRVGTPALQDFNYLYESFNSMAAHLDTLIQKELKQELLLQKAQLKQLQAQINPHFLYNSFFMLNQMIAREMNDSAKDLTKDLGIYFKYITRNYRDVAVLTEEYEHASVYTRIQARRFAGRISIDMQPYPKSDGGLRVPRLIFQPLLENSFQYGMNEKIRDGLIRVTFHSDPDALRVGFEDNGDTLSDAALLKLCENLASVRSHTLEEETTGMLNICKRLQLYYQRDDVMQAGRSDLGGLLVTVTLFREEALCTDC